MRMNYFLILLGCFLLAACQLPPTKSFSESSLRPRASHHESDQIFIGDLQKRGAVFVDVRSPFVAGLNRVPGAQNLWWEDFTVKNNAGVRKMQPDLFALTRRLALKGIAPDKPVVLVGSRIDVAAEGRLAWILSYLGVLEVYVLDVSRFRLESMNVQDPLPVVAAATWLPQVPKEIFFLNKQSDFVKNKNMFAICLKLEDTEFKLSTSANRKFSCDQEMT